MNVLGDGAVSHLRSLIDWPDLSGSRYEVVRPIGFGGMATVYLARDAMLDREVAIKVQASGLANDGAIDRLKREAEILAQLEHPGIVPVHEVGLLPDGRPFCVMKLVTGDRLDEWFAQGQSLSAVLDTIQRICQTVAFAHSRGVIHRDLKPSNIMVGLFGEVLILDWGIARRDLEDNHKSRMTFSSGVSSQNATQDGIVLGTPGYMAPEQARGSMAEVDARSDIFSLGVIIREMLSSMKSVSPRALVAIAEKASSVRPDDRYPGVGGLLDDVRNFLEGRPVTAHKESTLERATRVVRPHQTAIFLVLAYLALRVFFLISA